jgi:hypothetical protein
LPHSNRIDLNEPVLILSACLVCFRVRATPSKLFLRVQA